MPGVAYASSKYMTAYPIACKHFRNVTLPIREPFRLPCAHCEDLGRDV